jgi:hypothetical protein
MGYKKLYLKCIFIIISISTYSSLYGQSLQFPETVKKFIDMTEIQQKEYEKTILNKQISGSGNIFNVEECGFLSQSKSFGKKCYEVTLDKGAPRVVLYFSLNEKQRVIEFKKGEQLNFTNCQIVGIKNLGFWSSVYCDMNFIKNDIKQKGQVNDKLNIDKNNISRIFPNQNLSELFKSTDSTKKFLKEQGWKERKFGCNTWDSNYICFIKNEIEVDLEIMNHGPSAGKIIGTRVFDFNKSKYIWSEIGDSSDPTKTYINKKSIIENKNLINFELLMELPMIGPEGKSYITKYVLDCNIKMVKDIEFNSFPESMGEGSRNPIVIPENRSKFYKSVTEEINNLIQNSCSSQKIVKSIIDNEYVERNISIVNAFYEALSDGDGKRANTFIIPDKRNKGNFQEDKMSSFYRNMKQRLRIIETVSIDENTVKVTFEYAVNQSKCKGISTVIIKEVLPNQYYIDKILSNC